MKRSSLERYAYRLITENVSTGKDELYFLNKQETALLNKLRFQTLFKAGLAGALGVLLLYIPYHVFGETLFPVTTINLPFLEINIQLEIEFLIYSVVLVVLEIIYLTRLNIYAVSKTIAICGSYDKNDRHFESNINALIAVGLEKKQTQLKGIGINPYDGLSSWAVFLYQVLLKLKAALSGFLLKLVLTKILGRYVLRVFIDIAGVPLYAFWNIWGAQHILNEARVRVLAPPLIKQFADKLYDEFKDSLQFRLIIYDVLQAIATRKRSFHYNHYLLAVTVLDRFDVVPTENPSFQNSFLDNSAQYDEKVEEAIAKLLVFGILIDGKLSRRELRTIREMKANGVIDFTEEQVKTWGKDFYNGKGLNELIEY